MKLSKLILAKQLAEITLRIYHLDDYEVNVCKFKDFPSRNGVVNSNVAGQTTVGYYKGKPIKLISIEENFIKRSNAFDIHQNILHEVAHAIVYEKWGLIGNLPIIGGHGILWKRHARKIGYKFPSYLTTG